MWPEGPFSEAVANNCSRPMWSRGCVSLGVVSPMHCFLSRDNLLEYLEASQNESKKMNVESAKRLFTSGIQKVLDPRSRDEEFKRLLSEVAVS